MQNPKISIIIVYDNNNNLYDCVESLVQQSFANTEVICVNNGAKDNAENTVKELSEKIDRIKLISMPLGVDKEQAKKAGLSISQGEFVIFIENNEVQEADFIKNVYLNAQQDKKFNLNNKYLYRRTFLENDREISNLIEDRIKSELSLYSGFVEEQKQKINEEFEKFNRNNVENIKNNTYEIITRFNALEKQFYDKDWQNQERINNIENNFKNSLDEKINNIYSDIHKVYEYIDNAINNKNNELSQLHEEIPRVYQYSEDIIKKEINNEKSNLEAQKKELQNQIKELEKEIVLRYVNLKRIMDMQIDEIKERLNGG